MRHITGGFIVLVVLALAVLVVPLATRAELPATPVVGFLNTQSPALPSHLLSGFRQGLSDAGYVAARTWRSNIAGQTTTTSDCQP